MNRPDSLPEPEKRPNSKNLAELVKLFHTKPGEALELFEFYFQNRIFRKFYWAAVKRSDYQELYRDILLLVMLHVKKLQDPDRLPRLVSLWTRQRIRRHLRSRLDREPKIKMVLELNKLIQLLDNATDPDTFTLVREKALHISTELRNCYLPNTQ